MATTVEKTSAEFVTRWARTTTAGNVVTLTEMSRVPSEPPIRKISKTMYVDTRTGEVSEFSASTTRRDNTDSLRKTFRKIRDTINANCAEPDKIHWITLTYKENMTDSKRLYQDYRKFWLRFKYYCVSRGWTAPEYITIAEPQARGAWHCHVLFIWNKKRPFIANKDFASVWGQGFVRIGAVKDCDNLGAYLSAYLGDIPLEDWDGKGTARIKTAENGKKFIKGGRLTMYPVGMNIVRTSRGIKHPVVEDILPGAQDGSPQEARLSRKLSQLRILLGCLTYSVTFHIKDTTTGFESFVSKSYYNTKRKVSGACEILKKALSLGIPIKAIC